MNRPQPATGEQQPDDGDREYDEVVLDQIERRAIANGLVNDQSASRGLGKLDARDVVTICEIVYAVIDDGPDNDGRFPWDLYECADHEQVRHSFVSEVRKRIWKAAAPATTPAVKGAKCPPYQYCNHPKPPRAYICLDCVQTLPKQSGFSAGKAADDEPITAHDPDHLRPEKGGNRAGITEF